MIAVTISGNLVEDPKQIYETKTGAVYGLRIASNVQGYDREKREVVKEVEWAAGKVGASKIKGIMERLTKGRCVFLHSPAARIRRYKRNDGTEAAELDLGMISTVELGPPTGEWKQYQQQAAPAPQQAPAAQPFINPQGGPTDERINNPYNAPALQQPQQQQSVRYADPNARPIQPQEGYGPLPF